MKGKKLFAVLVLSASALTACAGKNNKTSGSSSSATSTTSQCDHQLTHVEEKTATYHEAGNVDYYYCENCGKYFDKDGKEIKASKIATQIKIKKYKDSEDPVYCLGRKLEVTYTDEQAEEFEKIMAGLLKDAKDETKNYSDIEVIEEQWMDQYYAIWDQYVYAYILAEMNNDEKMYAMQTTIMETVNKADEFNTEYDIAMANSKYRNEYYEGMTETEIDEYVASLNPEQNKAANALSLEMDEILNKYYSEELTEFEALSQYVAKANQYAALFSYSDYLAYSYENVYDREYSVADTSKLAEHIGDTIAPLNEKAIEDFYAYWNNTDVSRDDKLEIYNLLFNFFGGYLDDLENYAKILGTDYLDSYYNIFNTGNYFLSDIENPNTTGFTWTFADGTPFIFLGADYQDLGTFIHEFGHYNSSLTGANKFGGYDLKETQSQGNEALFYQYIASTKLSKQEQRDAYLAYQRYTLSSSITVGYLINEIEKYLYTATSFTQTELETKFVEIANAAGMDNYTTKDGIAYIYSVLLNYQGYYISYGTSAIAALEIGAVAKTDFNKAVEAYRSIYTVDDGEKTFSDALSNAKLYNVFSDEAYALLKTTYLD